MTMMLSRLKGLPLRIGMQSKQFAAGIRVAPEAEDHPCKDRSIKVQLCSDHIDSYTKQHCSDP